jgi:hypothetical protein
MRYYDDFDHLMPSHNEPWLGKDLLPASLAGAEKVASGQAEYREITDPWNRWLRQYSFGQFSILTPQQEELWDSLQELDVERLEMLILWEVIIKQCGPTSACSGRRFAAPRFGCILKSENGPTPVAI